MPANDFAVPRMEPSKQRSVQSMEEVRDWERLFVGEIKAGRDPRIRPACKEAPADLQRVAGFLDAYVERHWTWASLLRRVVNSGTPSPLAPLRSAGDELHAARAHRPSHSQSALRGERCYYGPVR